MNVIKDWVSCQLISRPILSIRPFSFFHEEPEHEQHSQGAAVTARVPLNVSTSPDTNQEERVPSSQFAADEVPCSSHVCVAHHNKKDPFAKIEHLQVNFLRLVQRLGFSSENTVVSRVLYRLQLASLIRASDSDVKRARLGIDNASVKAVKKETSNEADLDFSFRILVLGKTGVGKSATINSIFNHQKTATNAFQPATNHIEEVVGTLKGVKVTFVDTPGLLPSHANRRHNRKILLDVKRYIRKSPPDIVLYFERLDVINRGCNDLPLLKLISNVFGSSIWFSTILVMTHSSSAIPEGPDGYPVSYESLVSRRTSIVQHYVRDALFDNQIENPVLLVENHHLCKTNMEGEKILPNGIIWRNQFLLLCISSKILADANKLLKFQDSMQVGHVSTRLPSLPHLLSTFLRPHSVANASDLYNEMDKFSELDDKDDNDDYDSLPPIRILTKAQYQRLTKDQKNAYLDELDYRETLYLKKQWKEELRRRQRERMLHKEQSSDGNNADENHDASDNVPLPDMSIPLSFDSDNPVYRYRCILSNDQWLVRPVLDSQGWDHDVGFDGVNLETAIDMKNNCHASVVGQMSKDKEEFNLQVESLAKYIDPERSALSAGIDVQTAGKDLICTVHGDGKLKNWNGNITGCGLSLTSFRDMHISGAKVDDTVLLRKRFRLGMNVGCMSGCGQVAYGGGLEATLKGKDYPVRDDKTSLALTLISFDKDAVFSGSIQSNFRVGHSNKVCVQANLNNKKLGQISLKASTFEHLEIAFVAIITVARVLFRRREVDDTQNG